MHKSGFLVVNKPAGLTSRDVVNRAMAWFPKKTRLGHGGTLDPLATGVLVLAFGQGTRLLEYVQHSSKTYTALVTLGGDSDSDDADGLITPRDGVVPVEQSAIRQALDGMIGEVSQIPPAFSALKIDGKRAYELARKGAAPDLEPRVIRIDRIEILDYAWPNVRLRVDCGKGTYIRSIARDLGKALGVGGYVTELHRDRIGEFTLDNAIPPTAIREEAARAIHHITAPLRELPRFRVSDEQIMQLRFGRPIGHSAPDATEILALDADNDLVAIGKITGGRFHPTKVIPPSD